jgi:hypothetical protein
LSAAAPPSLTINKYANTTAATIPLCLWDYEKKLEAPGLRRWLYLGRRLFDVGL